MDAPNLVDPDVFTGIIELQSIRETIDLALGLHPGTKQVVFVVDNTPSGVYVWGQIQGLFKYYEDIRMTRIDESLSMEQIEDEVSNLSDDTIVLFGTFHRDNSAKYYSFGESASRVSKASARPMYGVSTLVLPYGIVGGKLFGGFYHGQVAAEMAQRILMGEKVRDIRVLTEPQTQYMFDYEQMQRWGIKISDLPEDSIVVNKPYSLYEENKGLIWGVIALVIFETLIIIRLRRNILRRKRAEEKLKKYSDDLEEMVEERTGELKEAHDELMRSERLATLGQFSGNISHELRNPLGVIDSSVYYLKSKLKGLDEKTLEHLGRIRSAVSSSTAIIESLLNLTRMKAPQLAKLDLSAVTSDAVDTSMVPAAVKIIKHFPEPEVLVNGDQEQLRMAFKNIVKNAVQAMDGEGTLTVTVRRSSDSQAEVTFADTGAGIAPENLSRVFEPLFSTRAKGIGFGLSIVKMIVDKHGGSVEAESKSGKGATIIIRLPLCSGNNKEGISNE